jgi:hypothetical protein
MMLDNKERTVFLANQAAFMSSMNIPINEEYDDLSTLYWIPKLHRNPYRERYICYTLFIMQLHRVSKFQYIFFYLAALCIPIKSH